MGNRRQAGAHSGWWHHSCTVWLHTPSAATAQHSIAYAVLQSINSCNMPSLAIVLLAHASTVRAPQATHTHLVVLLLAYRQPFSSFIRADHGEAAGNSTVSRVLVTAAYQLRRQGFNAVYLSLDLSDLQPKPKTPIPSSHNMCRQVSLIDTPRSSAADISAALQLPTEGHDDSTSSKTRSNAPQEQCLTLLPTTAMLDRFLWSVQWFLANGLYVIISGVDSSMCTSLNSNSRDRAAACLLTVNATADAWVQLWDSVKTLPGFEEHIQGRVMLQLLQDPSPAGLLWEASNTSTGHKQPGVPCTALCHHPSAARVFMCLSLYACVLHWSSWPSQCALAIHAMMPMAIPY